MRGEALVEYVTLSQIVCVSQESLCCVLCGSRAWWMRECSGWYVVKWFEEARSRLLLVAMTSSMLSNTVRNRWRILNRDLVQFVCWNPFCCYISFSRCSVDLIYKTQETTFLALNTDVLESFARKRSCLKNPPLKISLHLSYQKLEL